MKHITIDLIFSGDLYYPPLGRRNFLPFPKHDTNGQLEEKLYLLAVENFKYANTFYYKDKETYLDPDPEPICELPMEDLVVYATGVSYCRDYPSFTYEIILRNFKTEDFFLLRYGESCLEEDFCNNSYCGYSLKCTFENISDHFNIYGQVEYLSKNRIYKVDKLIEYNSI